MEPSNRTALAGQRSRLGRAIRLLPVENATPQLTATRGLCAA
ncbi:MAG: hypothetical protein ABSA39_00770 [Edaphobacter sp.]